MNRSERLAQNESRFRELNEEIERLERGWPQKEIDFVCECADETCAKVMTMTLAEYAEVRADPTKFAALRGHQNPDIERVVESRDRYVVVRKHTALATHGPTARPR